MSRSLADEAPRLRADLARQDVQLIIVDSLVPACGPEPEGADATIRTLNALRSFAGTTRLVIAHVNRNDADKTRGTTRPWGSVFVRNLARAAWEIKRIETDGPDLVLGAYLTKRNDGKRGIAPWGLRFAFADRWRCDRPGRARGPVSRAAREGDHLAADPGGPVERAEDCRGARVRIGAARAVCPKDP
jgi:hypothetical protein